RARRARRRRVRAGSGWGRAARCGQWRRGRRGRRGSRRMAPGARRAGRARPRKRVEPARAGGLPAVGPAAALAPACARGAVPAPGLTPRHARAARLVNGYRARRRRGTIAGSAAPPPDARLPMPDVSPALARKIAQTIADEIGAQRGQVEAAVALLDDGATVPFIARYRKEATGGLDDTQLRDLEGRLAYLRELEDRRAAILASIDEQGKLDDALRAEIEAADSKARLEDLYLPYKP